MSAIDPTTAALPPSPPPPRVALVVDGAGGPGRIVSTWLATAGSAVAVTVAGSGSGRAAFLSKELIDQGHTALPYCVDLDDPGALRRLIADIEGDLGPVDLLVYMVHTVRPVLPPALDQHVVAGLAAAGRPAHVVAVTTADSALLGTGPVRVTVIAPAADDQAVAAAVLAVALLPEDR
ncbi:SDR family NAD(P)-dependent oxidoreductase [Actinacidiphila sp. ITFR-21]|uniref:SDR family NAD(P)-dependent oxidoreductase n=1 Tax=Actinacidiphila sp. ITFR-21 TaxID=3075199 RepID=UPI00288BDCEC|nr:SDR family NAD(P)-dependent oxidoreductase [Streptomyces sp. ITFR-21]WNI17346.1 SDR family NAD(P)-dependent oxidoreductase [Streptomyces sp. ITFR-21]